MPRSSKDKSQSNIVLTGVSSILKARLKIESFRRDCGQCELILEILDKALPKFEEILTNKSDTTEATPNIPETNQANGAKVKPELNGGAPIQTTLLTR